MDILHLWLSHGSLNRHPSRTYYKNNHGGYINGKESKAFKTFVEDYNKEIVRRQEEERKRKELIALQKSTKKYFDVLSDFQPAMKLKIPPEFSQTRFTPVNEGEDND